MCLGSELCRSVFSQVKTDENPTVFIIFLAALTKYLTKATEGGKALSWLTGREVNQGRDSMTALHMTSTVRKQRETNAGWNSYCLLSAQQDVGSTGRWTSGLVFR